MVACGDGASGAALKGAVALRRVKDCPPLLVASRFLDEVTSAELYRRLCREQQWPANSYEVFGRRFTLPRLQTWHADPGIVYSYSDNLLTTQAWTALLWQIKTAVERAVGRAFNAVLVNYYRDGNDHVGWHSDDEVELGSEPYIASLSLGASRVFAYRHKHSQQYRGRLQLDRGSLLLMQPPFQKLWQHSVPQASVKEGRINLTFRYVYPPESQLVRQSLRR